jgi:hypothetical protein
MFNSMMFNFRTADYLVCITAAPKKSREN